MAKLRERRVAKPRKRRTASLKARFRAKSIHSKKVKRVFERKTPGTRAWVDGKLYEKEFGGIVERANPIFEKAMQYGRLKMAFSGKKGGEKIWFRGKVYEKLSNSVILQQVPTPTENSNHAQKVRTAFRNKKPGKEIRVDGFLYRLDKELDKGGKPFQVVE